MASTGGTAAKAAGAIAAGGGPEDPVGDVAAAGIVAKDTVASKGAQKGAKDSAKKLGESGGGAPDKKPARAKEPEGGKGKSGKSAPKSKTKRAVNFAFSGNQKFLTGQFIACVVVVILGTFMAPEGSKDTPMRALVKASALSGVFFLLALVASAGGSAAKSATALGTLISAAYLLTSSDVHNVVTYIAGFFKKPAANAAPTMEATQ